MVARAMREELKDISKRFNKPFSISEMGYQSADGTNRSPAVWKETPIDLQEQAASYQAALEVLWGKPWLKGIFWWAWDVPSSGGPNDNSWMLYGKPAEAVLKGFYLAEEKES